MLLGLCCVGWIARPFLRERISVSGLTQGSLTLVAGAALLLSTNFALSGKLAWTPGGYGVAFGRMLQDGIVAQYLRDHCPKQSFKLCPYRDRLPATADQFLWGNSMFNTLGRFQGLNDEMGFIVLHSLAEYPVWQAKAALTGTAQQLVHLSSRADVDRCMLERVGILSESPDRYGRRVQAGDRRAGRRRPDHPQSSPQHAHCRDDRTKILFRVRPDCRVAHHDCRSRTQPERSYVIKPQRVGRPDPSLPPAAPSLLPVLILPPEPDRPLAHRQGRARPRHCGIAVGRAERQRDERRQPARAAGEQHTGGNVGEGHAAVKQKPLPGQ